VLKTRLPDSRVSCSIVVLILCDDIQQRLLETHCSQCGIGLPAHSDCAVVTEAMSSHLLSVCVRV